MNKYLSMPAWAIILIIKCFRKQNELENEIDVKLFRRCFERFPLGHFEVLRAESRGRVLQEH